MIRAGVYDTNVSAGLGTTTKRRFIHAPIAVHSKEMPPASIGATHRLSSISTAPSFVQDLDLPNMTATQMDIQMNVQRHMTARMTLKDHLDKTEGRFPFAITATTYGYAEEFGLRIKLSPRLPLDRMLDEPAYGIRINRTAMVSSRGAFPFDPWSVRMYDMPFEQAVNEYPELSHILFDLANAFKQALRERVQIQSWEDLVRTVDNMFVNGEPVFDCVQAPSRIHIESMVFRDIGKTNFLEEFQKNMRDQANRLGDIRAEAYKEKWGK